MNTVICPIRVQLQVLRNEQVHKNVSYNDNFHLLSYSKIYFRILHSKMWQSLKEYILTDLINGSKKTTYPGQARTFETERIGLVDLKINTG